MPPPKQGPVKRQLPVGHTDPFELGDPLIGFHVSWKKGIPVPLMRAIAGLQVRLVEVNKVIQQGEGDDENAKQVGIILDEMVDAIAPRLYSWDLVNLEGDDLDCNREGLKYLADEQIEFLMCILEGLLDMVNAVPKARSAALQSSPQPETEAASPGS